MLDTVGQSSFSEREKKKKRNISRNEDLSSGENSALYSIRTGEQERAVMPLVTAENKESGQ